MKPPPETLLLDAWHTLKASNWSPKRAAWAIGRTAKEMQTMERTLFPPTLRGLWSAPKRQKMEGAIALIRAGHSQNQAADMVGLSRTMLSVMLNAVNFKR